jgi:hypothetical protein
MTPSRKCPTLVAVAAAVVLTSSLAACARSTTEVPSGSSGGLEPYSAQQSVEEFVGISYDYDPVSSPDALAALSSLVVTGTINRVQEGRRQAFPSSEDVPGVSTIVLVLRDVEVAVGTLEEGSDGFVYIELPNPGGQKPEAYRDGLRAGSGVVAYLLPAPDGTPIEGVDSVITDPDSGRPDGQPLYLTANPQALILQHDGDAIVWPMIGKKQHGRIEDTLPGGNLIAS